MLGFPIRTPPDHSSVANSPGLIAGSNVLHRLLMPRHPPCALHSLSNTHTTRHNYKDARVHYSTTQTTTPHPRTRHRLGDDPKARNQGPRNPPTGGHLMPQNP